MSRRLPNMRRPMSSGWFWQIISSKVLRSDTGLTGDSHERFSFRHMVLRWRFGRLLSFAPFVFRRPLPEIANNVSR